MHKMQKVLSCKGSTTSALLRHLQTKHNINRKQGHDDKDTTGENSSVVEVEPQGQMEKYLKTKQRLRLWQNWLQWMDSRFIVYPTTASLEIHFH